MKKNWYSGDLHQHSQYSSPLFGGTDDAPDTLEEVKAFMKSKGFSFGACSDHHNILNHNLWKDLTDQEFITIISKEISTTNGHVAAIACPKEIIYDTSGLPEEKRRREFIRICEDIRAHGGLAQLNHPRDRQKAISFPPAFSDILSIFDLFEIWNGSEKMERGTKNGDAFILWKGLLEMGTYLPITAGTDIHRIHEYMIERQIKTVVYAESLTRENILGALKKGHSYVTSGPHLDITVNQTSYGETCTHGGSLSIDLSLVALSEVDTLYIHFSGGRIEKRPIHATSKVQHFTIEPFNAQWVFFEAGSQSHNKAITNPIFLRKGE